MTLGVLCATSFIFFFLNTRNIGKFLVSGGSCHMFLFMNLIQPLYLFGFQDIRRTDSVYF